MKMKFGMPLILLLGLVLALASGGTARATDCNATKAGTLVVSPGKLQFYVTQEQLYGEEPITDLNPMKVDVTGYAYPETNTTAGGWTNTLDFCWTATKSASWITINGSNATNIYQNTSGTGHFTVGVDVAQLQMDEKHFDGNVTIYDGNVTVTSTLTTSGTATIPVRVYVKPFTSTIHYAAEKTLTTSDWADITMNVPITEHTSGALYVLVEQPSLAPGQVFAYRWDSVNGTRFDLFSQWGHPVAGAEKLYYAGDVQNTPIAIPFTEDSATGVNGTIEQPYDATDLTKSIIPVSFGGFRMVGLEGDMIVRILVGDSADLTNWSSWRELLYYVLHIRPITGTWIVTEDLNGQSFTYTDPSTGATYPMILNEDRGNLSGVWLNPQGGQTQLNVTYANNTDQVCSSLQMQGNRLFVSSCVMPGGYEVYFAEPSVWGRIEYLYKIPVLDASGGGYLEGTWMYKFYGDPYWSMAQPFSAVRQEVVLPLDPNCNCYLVNATVNGYAQPFIVDTGASIVLLSSADAPYMGVDLTNTTQCPMTGTATGVGGDIAVTYCYVDLEVEGRLSRTNVPVAFSDSWTGPGLLGMTFLDRFHISTNAADGTMMIAP